MYTCPTGDFSYHVAHILTTGSEYTERLGTQRLLARDALMGARYQLFPKLIYGAAAVTHSPQKLEDAFKSIWYKLLPTLCVNRNITKKYRMLPLQFQGLAFLNLNIDALSNKIHLLQSHWDTGGMLGHIKHIRCFRSRSDSAEIFFPDPLSPLAYLPPMGSFAISGNYSIDMELCFVFTPTLRSRFSGNRTAR